MDKGKKTTLYLAPLQGITDAVYRQVFVKTFYGIDKLMTPYITVEKGKIKQSSINDVLPQNNMPHSVIPQILANSPNDFIFLAKYLSDLGYNTINWNLGCPYPMVTNKQLGAGMLPHPDKVKKILEEAMPKIHCDISIKTRLGLQSTDDIQALIAVFNTFPLKEIIIHPRIAKQLYKGSTDLACFGKCVGQLMHDVVYNGDINTLEDYHNLSEQFNTIDKYMIGRGALANPFLLGEIKQSPSFSVEEKYDILNRFHNELIYNYNKSRLDDTHILNIMKNHWTYLSKNIPQGKKLLKQIKKSNNINDLNDVIRNAV